VGLPIEAANGHDEGVRKALLVLLLLPACDPGWHASGHVVDGTGAPVAGATVTLDCPGKSFFERGSSDPTGAFSLGAVGPSPPAAKCHVVVDRPGFAKRTLSLFDLCFRSTEDGTLGDPCSPGAGTIVLSPAAPVVVPGAAPGGGAPTATPASPPATTASPPRTPPRRTAPSPAGRGR
jgi:hypothetical protein